MRIVSTDLNMRREPLVRPFAFKGGAFTEKWLAVTGVRAASGHKAVGIAGLAILWSDPQVFAAHSETGGNMLMALVAERALALLGERDFEHPAEAIRMILPELHEYGRMITGVPALRKTFVLNSLVSLDNALWNLHAKENGLNAFDQIVPKGARSALSARQRRLVRLPAITYGTSCEAVARMAQSGWFLPKIKLGHPGSQDEMLAADMRRLTEMHALLIDTPAEYSECGRVLYYLDANGRYESPDAIWRLIEHMDILGMRDRVLLLEEPFPEEAEFGVADFPLMVAADESLHGVEDVNTRIDMGYGVMTLKAAGKTLSMTFEMAEAAFARNTPCIVADSSCVPVLVGWNQAVAARLPSLPCLRCGILESNGPESYRNWSAMVGAHPHAGAGWIEAPEGLFELGDDFYADSAGIFDTPADFAALVNP
ncbi:MAG: L-alanine-DL-glutamate epimerase [Lentisphaeria bacterium]|nr:L-alanine-DL-glutamate epimerase [Lentisphaeria bacterium]